MRTFLRPAPDLFVALTVLVGSVTRVAPAADSPAPPKKSDTLASIVVPKKPAYAMQCLGSGELVEKISAPPVDPPTPDQLRAFATMEREEKTFREEARAYQGRLTAIVRHHYEERRRRVLAAIDAEIAIEKKGLEEARNEAIRRLEIFVARYSGANADSEATPDAMFRLAALYEERARTNYEVDLGVSLKPAIALYRDAVAQFPGYSERAAVLYYLAHALTDSARIEESQQAFRVLACHNKFELKSDAGDAERLFVQPLPQDHDERFWNDWFNKNPVPLDQLREKGKKFDTSRALVKEEELSFVDPYAGCEPIPQRVLPGEEPRYLAEAWWWIGNHHFDQQERAGGPYNLNRAASAYDQSLVYKKPPLYGVAMYKQAWTYFKQQRYRTATEWFVKLLGYADAQEEKTGDPGADFRSEAFTYIAGSLTYVDFDGPSKDDPYIPRSDVLDLEQDPLVAEDKMAVALTRVQDPALVPQDKKWTVEIYKALAQEFVEITQNRNAIQALELTTKKFPLDRDAPVMVNRIAELYDQLASQLPEGSPMRTEYARKALDSRTALSKYVGVTPWTTANKNDPEALSQAEDLVHTGLQRAAADHTNYAREFYGRALRLSDSARQKEELDLAIAEYRLAAEGWAAYIEQDPTAIDAYESRFWLADSHYWVALLQAVQGRMPSKAELEAARKSAVSVRDSNEDDRYKQVAAFYIVKLADQIVLAEEQAFEESQGAQGIAKRDAAKTTGEGESLKVVKEALPSSVQAAVCARDEYNSRIPLESDPEKKGLLFAQQNAEAFMVYGQFDEAKRRFLPLYEKYCGKNEVGFNAWMKLLSMSNLELNAKESRALVESRSCSYNEDSKAMEASLSNPVMQAVAYLDAGKLFEEAMKMKDGPERNQKWRAAAAAYKVALASAPDRDEAPEAALNGAYAYKQVGEYDQAIGMYSLFIEKYGDPAVLEKLKKSSPESYEKRVGNVLTAYQALSSAYGLFFDYPKAAATLDRIGANEAFPQAERKGATMTALAFYSNLDDGEGMRRARKRLASLGATEEELAKADFVIASAALKKWDPRSPDSGANQQARYAAQTAMETYFKQNEKRRSAFQYVVAAAYHMATARRAARSPEEVDWWNKTIQAFDRYAQAAPRKDGKSAALGTVEADMAAEGEYFLIDQQIKKSFDYESGNHRFKGTIEEVQKQYRERSAKDAQGWFEKLRALQDRYLSPKWTTIAIARQGSIYDSLRTGLFNTRAPELRMFSEKEEKFIKMAETSEDDDFIDKVDQLKQAKTQLWKNFQDLELDGADRIVVDRYARALVLAQRYKVSDPSLTRAIRRLAFLSDLLKTKMSDYTQPVKELNYAPGMFQRMRPGVFEAPKVDPFPAPAPAEAAR